MADNTDEEHVDHPANTQPENLSEKIIPVNDTETITQNQETENMEIHHHPDLHHKPKKWKEYLLEFLMIFLAVTLGFFAENFREHTVNKEKEKHYVEMLAADLVKDTIHTNSIIDKQLLLLDKMANTLKINSDSISEPLKQRLFYSNFVYYYSWVPIFLRNESTITQLKSAGGFNVISKPFLIDSIGSLDNSYDVIKYNNEWYIKSCESVINVADQFIIVHKMPAEFADTAFASPPQGIKLFSNHDTRLSAQLYNKIKIEQSMLDLIVTLERRYKAKAGSILELLKKEYRLE
ncbi:MAG: hypothetical protein EKK37_00555 [Sphingobacteriales bacterium]|nr:MAG: hypothetical protein EKK37_00555 [Sphingobacteriales bacterium]